MLPAREAELPPRCNGVNCNKVARQCSRIPELDRLQICKEFHGLCDREQQRAYIVRNIRQAPVRQRTNPSARYRTNYYFLPKDGEQVNVCQTMFLNTLNISEKVVRTALSKVRNCDEFYFESLCESILE